jgi:hypothetical protein
MIECLASKAIQQMSCAVFILLGVVTRFLVTGMYNRDPIGKALDCCSNEATSSRILGTMHGSERLIARPTLKKILGADWKTYVFTYSLHKKPT